MTRAYKKYGTLEERFWEKVHKTSGCWNWSASVSSTGYGQIHVNKRPDRAHRVSWRLHFGAIPGGLFVLHKCDNRLCVKPDHLFLGTHFDNMSDMVRKGRHHGTSNPGESHPLAKKTAIEILKIRSLSGSVRQRDIARLFGISQTQVGRIVRGESWKHV